MGLLRLRETTRRLTLAAHTVLGRSPLCAAPLDDPRVSSEHARLRWVEGRWLLRDLGSTNGTWLNGERLPPGQDRPLSLGDQLRLGAQGPALILTEASGPVALARSDGGAVCLAEHGVLVVGQSLCVFEDGDGHWVMENQGEPQRVQDQARVQVEGEAWVLHLPSALAGTVEEQPALHLKELGLHFEVSPDEERVRVRVLGADQALPPRAHHYTLLTLARARLRDAAEGVEDPGWLHGPELARMLRCDEGRLNLDVFRIRRDLGALGVEGAGGVIERRRSTRELRVGVARLEVTRGA